MFKSKEYNQVASNFVSLSFLQIANYVLPLVVIPYLIRVIGIDYFGLLSFSTAVIMYFYIVTEYGFNLTATKEVSLNRFDKDKLIEIYSSVLSAKVILMLLCLVVLTLFVLSVPRLLSNWEIYFYTFGIIVGQVIFPSWLFQGMEKMSYVTFVNVTSKVIFTVAVFIFVNKKGDFYIVPILTSFGSIVAGLLSLVIAKNKFGVTFRLQGYKAVKQRLNDGWYVFISHIYTCIYTVSITFFLGIFTNDTIVGYYSISEKIAKVAGNIFTPVSDALFPYISKLVNTSPEKAVRVLDKLTLFSAVIMCVVSLGIFYFSDLIILLVTGDVNLKSVYVLKVLSFLPLVLTLSRLFAHNYLVNFNQQMMLSKIYLYSSLLSLILILSFIPSYQEMGAALSVMAVEVFAVTFMYFVIRKNITC